MRTTACPSRTAVPRRSELGISAISSASAWREFAAEILPRRSRVAIGLHLDLTYRPYGGMERPLSLSQLVAGSLLRSLDGLGIEAEFERQFDLFEDAMGFAPDHVDGHHHAHALPLVRDALLRVLRRRYRALPPIRRPFVRVPSDRIQRIVRRKGAQARRSLSHRSASDWPPRSGPPGLRPTSALPGFRILNQKPISNWNSKTS